MGNHLHLISNNGGAFRVPSVELSTVQMPSSLVDSLGYMYESCLFVIGVNSEVLARYDSLSEAVQGHHELSLKHNLKLQVK